MLINLSNHPKDKWDEKQLSTALRKYNSIVDLPFPLISPKANTNHIIAKAKVYLDKIINLIKSSSDKNNAVHLMGEFTFVYNLTNLLKQKGVSVIVSTSDRLVTEKDNKKIAIFNFVKFREY